MKWCPPNYQVQKGNHLLCCPLPTMLGGWVPPRQEEEWFSQSRSSRLWPVLYCHEQTTRSCQSPADTQKDDEMNEKTEQQFYAFFSLNITCLFVLQTMISLPILFNQILTFMSIGMFSSQCLCVCICVIVKLMCACVVRAVADQFPLQDLLNLCVLL